MPAPRPSENLWARLKRSKLQALMHDRGPEPAPRHHLRPANSNKSRSRKLQQPQKGDFLAPGLHTTLFILSSALFVFYCICTIGAWLVFLLNRKKCDSCIWLLLLCLSVTFRLGTAVVLITVTGVTLTRANKWIVLYFLLTLGSLALFTAGVALTSPVSVLADIPILGSDVIIFYLLKVFLQENQLRASMQDERGRRSRMKSQLGEANNKFDMGDVLMDAGNSVSTSVIGSASTIDHGFDD